MKRSMWAKALAMGLVTTMMLQGQLVFAATGFRFDKAEIDVKTSEDFSIDLTGDEIKNLYGFEVALSFDQAKVELVGKPQVDFAKGFSVGPKKASDGKVYFGFTKMGKESGSNGTIDLGEFKFKAKAPGEHTITLESVKVVDASMQSKEYKVGQAIAITSIGTNKASLLKDIKGHWAEAHITQIVNLGYMVGKTETEFKPNDKLTRAEMATILSRLVGVGEGGANTFSDLKGDEWYAQSIMSMSAKGLVKGYEDKTFRPENNMTRAETMAILARMERENQTYQKPQSVDKTLSAYKDVSKVPAWAKEEVAWAIEKGIIKGDQTNSLNMKDNITRAEIATILCRLMELENH